MSTLFTVSASWFAKPALYEQLGFAQKGDSMLLLQDAVLGLQSPIALASFLAKCAREEILVYGLADDVAIRGVDNQYDSVELLDYSGFVDLVIRHDKQVAW